MQMSFSSIEDAVRAEADAEYEAECEAEARAEALQHTRVEAEGSVRDEGRDEGRRQAPRSELCFTVDLTSDHNFYGGFSENLSATGIFVASYDLLPLGKTLHLRFTLPDGVTVESEAVVRWVRESTFDALAVWPGMGLEFVSLSAADRVAIDRFVAARDPIFFPG